MTKSGAIAELLSCKWLDQACRNIGKQDWEELRQNFWVKILEQPEQAFANIRNLQFFCVRIIINANTDKARKSKLKFTDQKEDLPAQDHIEIEQELHSALEAKNSLLGTLPMYDRVIFKLHESGVSCRKIAEFTSINRNEVNKTVSRVKNYIAQNVKYQPAAH